jgi:Lon protease-like protein
VLGIGRIIDYATQPDGTSYIEVLGLYRGRILSELPVDVFRRGRVEVLSDTEVPEEEQARLRELLSTSVSRLLLKPGGEKMSASLARLIQDKSLSLGHVLHSLVSVLVGNRVTRQSLLETEGVTNRTKRFVSAIADWSTYDGDLPHNQQMAPDEIQ